MYGQNWTKESHKFLYNYNHTWEHFFLHDISHLGTMASNISVSNLAQDDRPIILLQIFSSIHHAFSIQKFFDKKYVTSNSFASADVKKIDSMTTSEPMNKITCSSLCLRDSREECHAFRVNDKNECELIKNPEKLTEKAENCIDETSPAIWTSKDLLPSCKYDLIVKFLILIFSSKYWK